MEFIKKKRKKRKKRNHPFSPKSLIFSHASIMNPQFSEVRVSSVALAGGGERKKE
jgi:hypothetical protein